MNSRRSDGPNQAIAMGDLRMRRILSLTREEEELVINAPYIGGLWGVGGDL